jgi:hypothetical protein
MVGPGGKQHAHVTSRLLYMKEGRFGDKYKPCLVIND